MILPEAEMKAKRVFQLMSGFVVVLLVASCLAPTGPAVDSGSGSDGISITGSATYSDGGEVPADVPVSFTFDGEGSLDPDDFTGSPGSSVLVDGKLRAGDVVFEVTGTYTPDTGEFFIAAVGEVGGDLVEITISGVYDHETNTIVSGEVVVTKTPPGGTPEILTGDTVQIGESPAAPISDTSGTTEAQPPAGGTRFWEGTWELLNERFYYTVEEDEEFEYEYLVESDVATPYYEDLSIRVTGTPSQYKYTTKYVNSPDLESWYVGSGIPVVGTFSSTEVIVETLEESENSLKAVFKDLGGESGSEFSIQRLFIAPSGGLWGVSYVDNDGEDPEYTASSIESAKANLTEEDTIFYPGEEGVGLTKVD
jgi:hypothetical protein